MLLVCFLTTSTDLPQNANSEHYKQSAVYRCIGLNTARLQSVCVCTYARVHLCVLMLDCQTTANQSRDCSVYLGQCLKCKLHM